MASSLAGARVAVIGGDSRQLAVAEALAAEGALVVTHGLPSRPGVLRAVSTLREAIAEAAVVVLPISGASSEGRVATLPDQPPVRLDEEFWDNLPPSTLILAGSLPEEAKRRIAEGGHRLVEYAEIDEIAILNSIPTAEGALQLAMEALPITIHGACVFILGFGRVGLTTARLFHAVGAETWVVADRPALLARAYEMGCRAVTFAGLAKEIHRADLVVNTVPARVLSAETIALTKPGVYIIDLASAPGGVDFQAAQSLGRRAVHALGLPGRVAPETAGRILSNTLPAIIAGELAKKEG
ncbi:MAG: dipicolinate synthase subunit DpsA [Firmicutes bacterium]|nr:dipicolinate synthase subunit DpsA [Bacillota bacterium]